MGSVNLQLLLSALRARFGIFLLVAGITVLATVIVSLLLPKTYKSTVSLIVDAKEEQSLNAVLRPLMTGREAIGYMQTQMDVIGSDKVARMVVQDLKLAEDPRMMEEFAKRRTTAGDSITDWLADALREDLKIETSQSSVIRISFAGRDPKFTASVANGFAKSYIDTMLELRVEPTRQAAAWFDEQLKTLRTTLEDAQVRLTDYHRKRGIVSADERFDVENTRLSELALQMVRAQDMAADFRSREQQARWSMQNAGSAEPLPEVVANSLVQKLKGDLAVSEARLREMGQQYGPNYPAYQRQAAEVAGLRERLKAETTTIVSSMESAARQSQARESELRRAMAEQRARVLAIKEDRNELTVLARNVDSAQRAYDTAMQRAVESKVESRASQANVSVLSAAVVPRIPARPKIGLNIGLAALVGTMLGIGFVLMMELLDRRVRTRGDLEGNKGVPLLGVLEPWEPAGGVLLGRPHGAGRGLPRPI